MEIQYIHSISEEDYNRLRKAVGWSEIPSRQAAAGLKNTTFQVVAIHENMPIGMARVNWDGGYAALISDVVVQPEYQGRGIGKVMLNQIIDYLYSSIEPGERIMMNLLAAKDKELFYKKFGFEERPDESHGAGMSQWIIK